MAAALEAFCASLGATAPSSASAPPVLASAAAPRAFPDSATLREWWGLDRYYQPDAPSLDELVRQTSNVLYDLVNSGRPGHWQPSAWGLLAGFGGATLLLSFGALLRATSPVEAIFAFLALLLSLLLPLLALEAEYVAAIHLMVYPGAILIFFSFATLTTDQRGHWDFRSSGREAGYGGVGLRNSLTGALLRQLGLELRPLLLAVPLLLLWWSQLSPRLGVSLRSRHSQVDFNDFDYEVAPAELGRSTDLVALGLEIFQRRLLSLSLLGLLLLLAFLTALELLAPARRRRSSGLFPRLGALLLPSAPTLSPMPLRLKGLPEPQGWATLLGSFNYYGGVGWLLPLLPLLALGLGSLGLRRYAFLHSFLILEALGLLLNLFFVAAGCAADDLGGSVLVLFNVAVAAAETAVGLALFLALSQGNGALPRPRPLPRRRRLPLPPCGPVPTTPPPPC